MKVIEVHNESNEGGKNNDAMKDMEEARRKTQ